MDAIEKRANGVALSGLDEQRLRNHQLRMMRRAWLKDMKVNYEGLIRACSIIYVLVWSTWRWETSRVDVDIDRLWESLLSFLSMTFSRLHESHSGRSTTSTGAPQTSSARTWTSPTTGSSSPTSSSSPRASDPSIPRPSLTNSSTAGRWRFPLLYHVLTNSYYRLANVPRMALWGSFRMLRYAVPVFILFFGVSGTFSDKKQVTLLVKKSTGSGNDLKFWSQKPS